MPKTVTLTYRAVARNVSASALASLMVSSAPRIVPLETTLGLTFVSDTPTQSGAQAIRTIVYTFNAIPSDPVDDNGIGPVLTDFYTKAIAVGTKTIVASDPVTVV